MVNIVIKTVERCNINCTYCYFFNKEDKSYKLHPPYISREVIDKSADFLKKGCAELEIKDLLLTFHGGEPLMQGKKDFDYMCNILLEKIASQGTDVRFSLQTNAMLIDREWIDLFNKYKISIGVSIDGPKEYHDKYRIDKKGRGTFDRTVEKIKLLNEYKNTFGVIILCVANPQFSPGKAFDFFLNELNITQFDFLLPDAHHDDLPNSTMEEFGNYYCEIFDKLTDVGFENVRVRFINTFLGGLLGQQSLIYGQGMSGKMQLHPITISTNGNLSPVDDLRNTDLQLMNTGNVKNISLKEYYTHPLFREIDQVFEKLPEGCMDCCWSKLCKGGHIIHRFSKNNRFNNKSIYCEALKKIYGKIAKHLVGDGLSVYDLEKILGITN